MPSKISGVSQAQLKLIMTGRSSHTILDWINLPLWSEFELLASGRYKGSLLGGPRDVRSAFGCNDIDLLISYLEPCIFFLLS